MIYYSTEEIQTLFAETDFSPRRWFKNILNINEQKIFEIREKNRLFLREYGWSPKTTQLLDLVEMPRKEFLIPTLNIPEFFRKHLSCDLKTSLSIICRHNPKEREILEALGKAELSPHQKRFFCLQKNDELVINGNNNPTVGNLLFLAHEVGHCLFENENKLNLLGSEISAFLFEDYVAKRFLSASDLMEWEQFKLNQDNLNFKLAHE